MSFKAVKSLIQERQYDEAIVLASKLLNEKPDDPALLYMLGRAMNDKGWTAAAQPIAIRSVALAPAVWEGWNLLGNTQLDLWQLEEARESFRLSLQLGAGSIAISNMAQADHLMGKTERAIELSRKSLKMTPDHMETLHNLGMFLLSLRQWVPGWEYYERGLSYHDSRKECIYGKESRWDGSKGKKVVAYGEQGLGDEISFASCIPDLIRDSKEVVIDCDNRLEGLFRRSFPDARVFGTRYRTAEWVNDYTFDARVAFGSLPKFYRRSDSEFPGTPYLVADPERRTQWRALLEKLPGLKVGIAWTGGVPISGSKYRSIDLESLLPILSQKASFVSLEYKDRSADIAEFHQKTGIKIHEWGRATRTLDYDDTAALVAELDLVISVTTSVIHLAGALGKECWVMTHKTPMWRYGYEGPMPWYPVKLYRQKTDWTYVINRIAEDLCSLS